MNCVSIALEFKQDHGYNSYYIFRMEEVILFATLVVMVLRYTFVETGRLSEHDGKD